MCCMKNVDLIFDCRVVKGEFNNSNVRWYLAINELSHGLQSEMLW